jgi:hypothetical protein
MKEQRIFLSRRNLLSLLSKLDRQKKGEFTACTLIKYDNRHPKYPQSMEICVVSAVEDEEYYGSAGREAGVVHPADDPNNKQ